jgi:hypothetical protein
MRIAVALLLSLLSVTSAAAPFEVSPPTTLSPAPYARFGGTAAENDSGTWLAVWSDTRPLLSRGIDARMIRGTLFIPGDARQRADFAVAGPAEPGSFVTPESEVEVASTGHDFLVAYTEATPDFYQFDTRFARVSPSGEIEQLPTVIRGSLQSMTATRAHYFVVTSLGGGWSRLAILDRNGRVVRAGLSIARNYNPAFAAVLHTLRDGRLLLLWNDHFITRLEIAIVEPYLLFQSDWTGARATAIIPQLPTSAGVAEGADRILITGRTLYRRNLVMSGAIDERGILLHRDELRDPDICCGESPVVLASGDGFTALFPGNEPLRLEYTAEGRPAGTLAPWSGNASTSFRVSRSRSRDKVVVATKGETVVAYRVVREGTAVVQETRNELAYSLATQEQPAVAQCRGVATIAWTERTGTASVVRFRRFSSEGAPLDRANRGVAAADVPQAAPFVTCGRRTTLISWTEGDSVRGLLIPDEGEPLDAGVLTEGETASVIFDGLQYVLLTRTNAVLRLTRLHEEGRWFAASDLWEVARTTHHALAWNGDTFMLVWRSFDYDTNTVSLFAQPIDRFFAPIGVPEPFLGPVNSWQAYPLAVTASPEGWLVGWLAAVFADCGTFTMRLGREGSPHDPHGGVLTGPLASARWRCDVLQLGWNGGAYEVLTDQMLATRTLAGDITTRQLADPGERLSALTFDSGRRLLVSWFIDPASGQRRLYGELVP